MLPKVVLGSDESLALSQAQKLLVIIYYSGPQFMLDQLQSPVCDCFSDVFSNQGHIIFYILNEKFVLVLLLRTSIDRWQWSTHQL